jgi:anti-anti-sigma regulatory factor
MAKGMNLVYETDGARTRVVVRGALEGASCDCLRHFWEAHCVDPATAEIVVDLMAVDHVDSTGVESLRALIAESRERGMRVSVVASAIVDQGAFRSPS